MKTNYTVLNASCHKKKVITLITVQKPVVIRIIWEIIEELLLFDQLMRAVLFKVNEIYYGFQVSYSSTNFLLRYIIIRFIVYANTYPRYV